MKQSKFLLVIIIFLTVFSADAQNSNVFLDRGYWIENPTLTTVKQRIDEGNDATVFNENGFDATTYALITNVDVDVVKFLLSFKENSVDKRTHDSRIYLHWAAYGGNQESVKLLLDMNSDVNARDSRGNTPLIFAAGSGLTNPAVYDLFVSKGVDLKKERNQQDANLLLLAAPYLKNEKDVTYFINNGLDLNSTDKEGNGIFNYASKRGNIEFLKFLVNKNVEFNSLNKKGGNAFMFVAQGTRGFNNSIEVYKFLQSLGINPNIVTKDGSTPLHSIANTKVDKSIFEFFLKAGANVDQMNSDGNTPFLNASSRNSLEIVKLLAKHSNNLNTVNKKRQSALTLAVENNNPDIVEFLLKQGLDAKIKDSDGNSLAYYLVESFNAKNPKDFDSKVKMLQAHGLKMNTIQAEKNTLYHLAAKKDNLDLIKRVAKFNIDVNAVNAEGTTALQQAAMKAKNAEVLKYLISRGADKKATTEFGETAYDLASENEFLQKKNVDLKFLN